MSDPVSGGIQAAGGLISGISNAIIGAKQLKLQREQFAYQKELNNTMMQREDNAVQRRAADMAEAGINKNLAAGQPASAGPMSVGQPVGQDGGSIMAKGFEQLGQVPMQAFGLGMQMSKSFAEIDHMSAQADNQDAQAKLADAKAVTEAKQQGLISAKEAETWANKNLLDVETGIGLHNLEKSRKYGLRTNDIMRNVVEDSRVLGARTDGNDNFKSLTIQLMQDLYGIGKSFLGSSADAIAKEEAKHHEPPTHTSESRDILKDKDGNTTILTEKTQKRRRRK